MEDVGKAGVELLEQPVAGTDPESGTGNVPAGTDPAQESVSGDGDAPGGTAAEDPAGNEGAGADPVTAPETGKEEQGQGKPEEDPADPSETERLEQREADLAKREADLRRRELEGAAQARFRELGLPESLLPYAVQEDEAATMAYIDRLKTDFDAAVEARLGEKIAGKTPNGSSGTVTDGDKTDADVFAAALRG